MTNTRFKDFGGNSSDEKPPLSFKLHEEEFHCVPQLQGKVLLDLISKANSGDAAASASIMGEFFEHSLTEESYVRFDTLLKSKDKIVQVETLSEIVSWLIGEYSDRPNSQPEAS
jgi:hypothetical protein